MVAAERRVLVKPWVRRNAAAHGSKPRASPRPRRGRSSITSANAVTRTHRSAAECSCLGLSPGCGLCPYRWLNKDPPLRGLHCGSREAPAPSRCQCLLRILGKIDCIGSLNSSFVLWEIKNDYLLPL